jgi:hypothetical protein
MKVSGEDIYRRRKIYMKAICGGKNIEYLRNPH